MTPEREALNTDRELWREREGDFYANSIFVTTNGGIGINVGGYVYVKPLAEWHKLAGGKEAMQPQPPAPAPERMRDLEHVSPSLPPEERAARWRMLAMHYESEWGRCSQHLNRIAPTAPAVEPVAWITKAALEHWLSIRGQGQAHSYTFLPGPSNPAYDTSALRIPLYTGHPFAPVPLAAQGD